jgi:hypothetical protein
MVGLIGLSMENGPFSEALLSRSGLKRRLGAVLV